MSPLLQLARVGAKHHEVADGRRCASGMSAGGLAVHMHDVASTVSVGCVCF